VVTVIRNSDDEPITTGTPGQIVYIVGTYFGTKAPQVWFEHDQNGRIKATKCKVEKDRFWYQDAKSRPGCMNPETGESMVPVQLPDANKIPDGGFLGFIVLDNGLGRTTFDFTIE
jgi:hypothetical protein